MNTLLRVHLLLQALCAGAALREEGLVVVRRRQLRARVRAHFAQQLDAAVRYLVLAFSYHLQCVTLYHCTNYIHT